MTFGETLKRLRQRNNISQDELAKKLNVKQYVISSWEIGRSEPNIEQIKFLSTYFKVPTDYLLGKNVIMVDDEKINGILLPYENGKTYKVRAII